MGAGPGKISLPRKSQPEPEKQLPKISIPGDAVSKNVNQPPTWSPNPVSAGGEHPATSSNHFPPVSDPEIYAVPEGEIISEHVKRVSAVVKKRSAFVLNTVAMLTNGINLPLRVLIDTGSELNLVKTGLIPESMFQISSHRVTLVTANNSVLPGGKQEVALNFVMKGYADVDKSAKLLKFPTMCREADIGPDVILSFSWLVDYDLDLMSKRFGLRTNTEIPFFIPGVENDFPAENQTATENQHHFSNGVIASSQG